MQDREQAFSVAAVKVEHLSPVSTLEQPRAYRFHQVLGSPSRRSLGCKSQSVATPSGSVEMMRNVETYLEALQDERRKIEAFKRELPLCMQLLDHAIEASREQLVDLDNRPLKATAGGSESCEGRDSSVIQCSNLSTPRTEGVTPVTAKWDKLRTERHYDKDKQQKSKSVASNKPSWMVEGHLWDQPCGDASHRLEKSSTVTEEIGLRSGDVDAEQATSSSPRLALSSRQRPAGAFLPFIREKPSARPPSTHSDAAACNGTDLSLSSPGDGERTSASGKSASGVGMSLEEVGSMDGCLVRQRKYAAAAEVQTAEALCGVEGGPAASTTTSSSGQASRKARRCWSPELHRRFVGALQQLGGAQVATPKQIRELMKVDGLTNDEVKSHLQKYRLHTRRPSPAPQAAGSQAPQLVVLGGIWMPPEYAAAAAAAQQSSPPGMAGVPPFCPPALSTQEYYSHLSHQPTQLQLRQSPFYEQQQAASQTQSSPNAPKLSSSPRDCANSNHSFADDSAGEEGKSESTSWKGENGVQEDDGEEGDMTVARKNTNLQSREDGKISSPTDMEEVHRAKLDITL